MLQTCVIMLAEIYLVLDNGALLYLPALVGSYGLPCAVLVENLYLAHEARSTVSH